MNKNIPECTIFIYNNEKFSGGGTEPLPKPFPPSGGGDPCPLSTPHGSTGPPHISKRGYAPVSPRIVTISTAVVALTQHM